MKFGICLSLKQALELKEHPFDYVEEGVQRFLVPERPQQEFEVLRHEAKKLPVEIEAVNTLLPGDMLLVATPTQEVDMVRIERYIKTTLQRAEEAGVSIIVFGSGTARRCPDGYDKNEALLQIRDHFVRWCTWARDYQVQFVLEPLRYAETNILNTVTESGLMVKSIEDTGARLLADVYHMRSNQEAPETLPPWISLLSHVHVAELEGRRSPGQHGDDFRGYFHALSKGGYDQRISIECNWQNLEAEIGPGIATLRQQWAESV